MERIKNRKVIIDVNMFLYDKDLKEAKEIRLKVLGRVL